MPTRVSKASACPHILAASTAFISYKACCLDPLLLRGRKFLAHLDVLLTCTPRAEIGPWQGPRAVCSTPDHRPISSLNGMCGLMNGSNGIIGANVEVVVRIPFVTFWSVRSTPRRARTSSAGNRVIRTVTFHGVNESDTAHPAFDGDHVPAEVPLRGVRMTSSKPAVCKLRR